MRPIEGAMEVRAAGSDGSFEVAYWLETRFPAAPTIEALQRRLPGEWAPRSEDYFNPGISTSNSGGWSSYRDLTSEPESWVFQWQGGWNNPSGDYLSLDLLYRDQGPFLRDPLEPASSRVRISMALLSAERAQEMREAVQAALAGVPAVDRIGRPDCRTTIQASILEVRPLATSESPTALAFTDWTGTRYSYEPSARLLGSEHFCRDGIMTSGAPPDEEGVRREYTQILLPLTQDGGRTLARWSAEHGGVPMGVYVEGELVAVAHVPEDARMLAFTLERDAAAQLRARLVGAAIPGGK